MFYVVAAQQDLHFRQVFKLLELMEYDWVNKCEHINFGMVKGMSTRKGTVVFLEDMLNEAKEIMLEKMKVDTKGKLKEIEDPEKVRPYYNMNVHTKR
jgi:arginyl-tRNA synthetase